MFLVGLTGGIGTGKSTVSQVFIENGIPVVDADVIARKVVEPGKKAWKAVKEEFGDDIFHESGELNRSKLGDIIFNDKEKRRKLNHITHPEIMKEIVWTTFLLGLQGHNFIVLDLPLLFEIGELVKFMHKIIVVSCEPEQQLERLSLRNKYSMEHAKQRIDAQMTLEKKCEMADFVIDNSGSMDDTVTQTLKVISFLKSSKFHWKIRTGIFMLTSLVVIASAYFIYQLFLKES